MGKSNKLLIGILLIYRIIGGKMSRKFFINAISTLLVLLFSVSLYAQELTTPREDTYTLMIKGDINAVSEMLNKSVTMLRQEDSLICLDKNTGEKKWKLAIKGLIDDAPVITVQDSLYFLLLKKSIVAVSINTGIQIWETPIKITTEDYKNYFDMGTHLILETKEKLYALDLSSGKLEWEKTPEYSQPVIKAGASISYFYKDSWGGRILLLLKTGPQLCDAVSGNVLYESNKKFTDNTQKPVLYSGTEFCLILLDKSAICLNLKDARETWAIDQSYDDAGTFDEVRTDEEFYAIFSFNNVWVTFNGETGDKLWTSSDALQGRIYQINQYEGDIIVLAARNYFKGTNPGDHLTLYRVSPKDGSVKWTRVIGYSTSTHTHFTLPVVNVTVFTNLIWCEGPFFTDQGIMCLVYGNSAKKVGNPNEKWKEKGGQELIMIDPATGEYTWRKDLPEYYKNFVDYANALKDERTKLLNDIERTNTNPISRDYQNILPEVVIDNNSAYISDAKRTIKYDLSEGNILWENPNTGYTSMYLLIDNYLYGFNGYSENICTVWYNNPSGALESEKKNPQDVILKSGEFSYFCLDAQTGNELWRTERSKDPYDIYDPIFNNNQYIMNDGKTIRCLELTPTSNGFTWSIDLKKEKLGTISSEEGVYLKENIFTVDNSVFYKSDNRTYKWSQRELGMRSLADSTILVLTEKGFTKINRQGQIVWKNLWDWNPDNNHFNPFVFDNDNNLLYQQKDMIYSFDLKEGKNLWVNKGKKNAKSIINFQTNTMYLFNDDSFSSIKAD